ncbi:MAG TPA: hypothetical protein VNO32_61615 [Candidatus Acidoferrum sp.]|nr:hypothetical protein [Candidatus Acidoferrum sp.]
MKTLKWRFLLSVAGLALAAILFHVALVQERTMHKNHPDYFHEGYYVYTPPALTISYSLNAPSLVLSQFINNLLTRHFNWTESWFRFGEIEYYVIVFAFWWCVGWRIDARGSRRNGSLLLRIVCALVGTAFSILLVYGGIVMPKQEYGTRAIPISMLLWGLALLSYFGIELTRRPGK